MKNKLGILLAAAMLAVLVIPASASQSKLTRAIDVISVVQDQSVTIRTSNFPVNDTIDVRMGLSGTLGIGGILVTKLTTGAGGSFLATFHIPPELQGQQIISIRLESTIVGFPAIYDYFYNNTAVVVPGNSTTTTTTTSTTVVPTWRGIQEGMPRFDIIGVVKGASVSVKLINYPASRNYAVYLKDGRSAYTTWYDVAVFDSASGGIFTAGPWNIPAILKYSPQISIKIYDTSRKIFTVNRFDNENYP